jgi:hypothetical protein
MTGVSERLRRRISRDFPQDGSAEEVCRLLEQATESERVQAAIVFSAASDLSRLMAGAAEAMVDWRDVLVAGRLADEDWRRVLDDELGLAAPS